MFSVTKVLLLYIIKCCIFEMNLKKIIMKGFIEVTEFSYDDDYNEVTRKTILNVINISFFHVSIGKVLIYLNDCEKIFVNESYEEIKELIKKAQ